MENIEAYKDGNKLVIIINLDRERTGENRLSKSEKNIMVGSAQMRYQNSLDEKVTIGINAYKKNPDFKK
jgi:hypothetical protein|tara:strand:+ start:394 stop:600 length:207 start_codon:yes stop_codon:yes gene_type:complete